MKANPYARWSHERPSHEAPVESAHIPAIDPPAGRTDFVDYDLRQNLTEQQGPVFMLLDSEFRDIPDEGVAAVFIPEPFVTNEVGRSVGLLSATREDSKHIVQFGQLVVSASDRRERVELVAIKPQSNVTRAINEFRATQYINGFDVPEGRPRGFEQLGFYRDVKRGSTCTISRYEHSVLTLDTLLWDEQYAPTERQICAAMGHCAVILGDLHSEGVMHGDAQAKNIAADNQGPRIIDMESARRPKEISDGLDPIAAYSMVSHDLRYTTKEFEQWRELLTDWFTIPYLSIVNNETSRLPEMAIPSEKDIRNMVS